MSPKACAWSAIVLKSASVAVVTMPITRSECPARYFVPAWIERSTPCSRGRKNIGVAQVLSIATRAPRPWAAFAIAGTSCISKVSEPGASV